MSMKSKVIYPFLPTIHDKRKKLSDKDKASIRTMRFTKGLPVREIASIFGVDPKTILYWTGNRERYLADALKRFKAGYKSPNKASNQKTCYLHRQEVLGAEKVRKFQREYKQEHLSYYTDYRYICKNQKCPHKLSTGRGKRFSSRIHKVCPVCSYPQQSVA